MRSLWTFTSSVAGAIVANTLFLLGGSFLLGGLKHHVQEYNRLNARLQTSLLFLATIAMLIPSAVLEADSMAQTAFSQKLSMGLSVLLILAYGMGLVFSLKPHREIFAGAPVAPPTATPTTTPSPTASPTPTDSPTASATATVPPDPITITLLGGSA